MGTRTIGLRDDVCERLKARKQDGESFTDLVDRLLDEATADWREGFGTLDPDDAEMLERAVEQSRGRMGEGLANRQEEAPGEMSSVEDPEDADETA